MTTLALSLHCRHITHHPHTGVCQPTQWCFILLPLQPFKIATFLHRVDHTAVSVNVEHLLLDIGATSHTLGSLAPQNTRILLGATSHTLGILAPQNTHIYSAPLTKIHFICRFSPSSLSTLACVDRCHHLWPHLPVIHHLVVQDICFHVSSFKGYPCLAPFL